MLTAITSWATPSGPGLVMLQIIYTSHWPCKVENLLSPFNEWGPERLTDFPRVTQLIGRRAGILSQCVQFKLKHASEAKCLRNIEGNWSYWAGVWRKLLRGKGDLRLLSEVNEGWAKEEGFVFCRLQDPGRKWVIVRVISNNQSPSSSQMSGWPWLKRVPAPEMPERASSYGFHSWQQSGVERNHEKEESRIGGGARTPLEVTLVVPSSRWDCPPRASLERIRAFRVVTMTGECVYGGFLLAPSAKDWIRDNKEPVMSRTVQLKGPNVN